MVAESLEAYEKDDDFLVIGSNCPNYPYHALSEELRAALASSRVEILDFAKKNPSVLNQPFGYDIFTGSGNPRRVEDWRERNILAARMRELGFESFKEDLAITFSDCLYQAERMGGGGSDDAKEWALNLAYSSAALFTIHVLNIYIPQRGLFANMLDANLQHDALDRANYKPAITAISKAVKKALGWKGNAEQRDEFRAELIISFIEAERQEKAAERNLGRGIGFEKKCLSILESEGFEVRETPKSGDFGADLLAEKHDLTFAIQCKDLNKPAGVKAVQEAVGARRHYTTDFACVCADSGFTDAALELAASNRIVTTTSANLSRSLDNAPGANLH